MTGQPQDRDERTGPVREWADATGCTTAEAIEAARRFAALIKQATPTVSAPKGDGDG